MRNLQKSEWNQRESNSSLLWSSSRIFPLISCFVPLCIYIATLAPTVLNDDPAEYQAMLAVFGVAHPTGYPLYTLLGFLFTHIVPVGDGAYRANLFSAVAGAAAMATLYALLTQLRVASFIALFSTLAFSLTTDVWTYATIAQTYALNLLLIGMTLLLFVRYQARRDTRTFAALAFVAGLGVAHHSTYWLLLPALALAIALTGRRSKLSVFRQVIIALPFFVVPLMLYLYIPVRGEALRAQIAGDVLGYPRFVVDGWVTPHYLPGWTNVVLGSFYASSTLGGATADWVQASGAYLNGMFHQFGLEIILLVVAPLVLWRRNSAFAVLVLVAWLTNVVIVMRGVTAFGEPAGGLYTPTYLFAAISLALLWDLLARLSARYETMRTGPRGWLVRLRAELMRRSVSGPRDALLVIMLAVLLFTLMLHGVQNIGAHQATVNIPARETAARQLRDTLPNAAILGAWSQITPLHYLQVVEGVRPDVTVFHAPLTDEFVRDISRRAAAEHRPLYTLQPSGELILVVPP